MSQTYRIQKHVATEAKDQNFTGFRSRVTRPELVVVARGLTWQQAKEEKRKDHGLQIVREKQN